MKTVIWQLFFVPIFVSIWFFSFAALGVDVSFTNGTAIRLRGWWRE